MSMRDAQNPLLLVLSGPSGVGKDLLLSRLREAGRPYHFTVTATTRPIRGGELDGVDYHFVTRDQFEAMIDDNALLEWANVYGNYYGVPKAQVMQALNRGQDVILKIDVQGAATVPRDSAGGSVHIPLPRPARTSLSAG